MELKRLHTFLILSEIKNFTKTAEYLHYAQSNVTTQIQQLEEELGVRLFERIGKNITLTPEGVCVLPKLSVQKELENGELVPLNYLTNYKIASQLVYHKDKWISKNLKDFIDTVKKVSVND